MATKEKNKVKMKDKSITISPPLDFIHKAHVGKESSQQTFTTPQGPISDHTNNCLINLVSNSTNDDKHLNDRLSILERKMEEIKQEFIKEAVASIKDEISTEIQHTVHKAITETLRQYKFHPVSDDSIAYLVPTPVCKPGTSHDSNSGEKPAAGNDNNTNMENVTQEDSNSISDEPIYANVQYNNNTGDTMKLTRVDLNKLFDEGDYSNVQWMTTESPKKRHTVDDPPGRSMLAADEMAATGYSDSTPSKQRPKSDPSDRHTTFTAVSDSDGPITAADDRECLARALQSHVVTMVNNVTFTETELPDMFVRDGYLTTEECYSMRELPNRNDRIRKLISVITGRDTETIKGFLEHLREDKPDIVEDVYTTYEANKSNGMRCKLCVFCMIKTKVDIKYVADSIWSIYAIPDGLYNEMIATQKPAGAKKMAFLWDRLADCCNLHDAGLRTKVLEAIAQCLTVKNYRHISDTLTSQVQAGNSRLECRCKVVPLRPPKSWLFGSNLPSLSPRSSHSSYLEPRMDERDPAKPKPQVPAELSASLDSINEELKTQTLPGRRQPTSGEQTGSHAHVSSIFTTEGQSNSVVSSPQPDRVSPGPDGLRQGDSNKPQQPTKEGPPPNQPTLPPTEPQLPPTKTHRLPSWPPKP